MSFNELIEGVGKAVDGIGVGITIVGIVVAFVLCGVHLLRPATPAIDRYRTLRRNVGRSVLLGLEVLVAGDIIRTVAISPTFTSVGVLAVIVAVRTFLSFTLEVELSGQWPWQPGERGAPVTSAETS